MSAGTADSRTLYLRLLRYVRPYWRIFALAVFGMVATAATDPLVPAMMKPLLDGGFGRGEAPLFPPAVFAGALLAIILAHGVFTFITAYGMGWVGNRVILDLRKEMFERLIRYPTRFFDEHTTGALLSRVTYDVMGVAVAATTALTTLVRDALTVLGLIAWLFYLNWRLTLVALAVGPVIALVVRMFSRRFRTMALGTQEAMGDMTHVLEEAIGCHKVVKIFGGQEYEARRFRHVNQTLRGLAMRQIVAASSTAPITHLLAGFALAVIVYVALRESLADRASVGEFVSFIMAMLMLLAPLKRLTEVSAQLQRGLAAAQSVFGMIDTPAEEDRGTVRLGRVRGEIAFEGVRFTYATRSEPALDGVDLRIRPGETVALVGGSGGGKTTLVNLVPRFYVPDAGRILLDGHDLQEVTLESLRANVALVSQEVVLFNDTIEANIAYGTMGGADRAKVIAAAEAAHAMDFIREAPQGLDTPIGEKGLRLSGGQRQRLAIARALLKDAPVLILDEATSALDSESERQVQSALDVLMRGRTTLVIAHRLSTIERADRIVVLERGRIVETGAHAELIARGGTYAKLHRIQYETRT